MHRDVRGTDTWALVEQHFAELMAPGFGRVTGAVDPAASPDGRQVAFTGSSYDKLESLPRTRVCIADGVTGEIRAVSSGHGDRLPRWSPDGRTIAFLSDRVERGVHQLFLLGDGIAEAEQACVLDGVVEYHHWSPDGRSVLLAVADLGADLAGGQGSGTVGGGRSPSVPDWLPDVRDARHRTGWRRLYRYDVTSGEVRRVSGEDRNIWEATWLGGGAVAAIVSDGPGEELWYDAELVLIDADTSKETQVLTSQTQLGVLAGSPAGTHVAVVEAVCSDRWVVAGELTVSDVRSGSLTLVDTAGTDVTWCGWRDADTLAWVGIRGTVTVAGEWHVNTSSSRVTWESAADTCGLRHPEASVAPSGALAVVLESYQRYPEITLINDDGSLRTIASLAHPGAAYLQSVGGSTRPYRWTAPDGLEVEGLLTLPDGDGPFPLIMLVHGGPVWSYRPKWSMYYHYTPFFASRGWAVLHPNPRGSSGRGQNFARAVLGDMGGEDSRDLIAGVESLVDAGTADPARLVVMGASYGGFMSAWLPTQTDVFAAAVAIAEVSEWKIQHWTSNIPHFDALFLGSNPFNADGNHSSRSPLSHAAEVRTPMLHITGALDRCTPASQAIAFHRALLEAGGVSECVVYPEEGHGVRSFPAVIDHITRIADFLDKHASGEHRQGGH